MTRQVCALCTGLTLALSTVLLPAIAQEAGPIELQPNESGRVVLVFNGRPAVQTPAPAPRLKPEIERPVAPSPTIRPAPALRPAATAPEPGDAPRREVRYMTVAEWAAFQAAAAEREESN